MLNDQKTSAVIYKQLFTDSEWDAISSALNDYQDYGTEEANLADSIQSKISTIYRLTENDSEWFRVFPRYAARRFFHPLSNINMQESKFNLYGEFIRPNGHQNYDILSYIAETREDAIATCKRLNPHFNIITIQVDDTAPEVVKLQSLIWN